MSSGQWSLHVSVLQDTGASYYAVRGLPLPGSPLLLLATRRGHTTASKVLSAIVAHSRFEWAKGPVTGQELIGRSSTQSWVVGQGSRVEETRAIG